MRTCSVCGLHSADSVRRCPRCQSDLDALSATALAKKQLLTNPRVSRVRVLASADSCPACQNATGEFAKSFLPDLPVPGCSHPLGCRCFYEPALATIFP